MRLLLLILILLPRLALAEITGFPYPYIAVPGAEAEDVWHILRSKPGTPVIIGEERDFEGLRESFNPEYAEFYPDSPNEIIARAAIRPYPEAYYEQLRTKYDELADWLRSQGDVERAEELEGYDPTVITPDLLGEWPESYPVYDAPGGYIDYRTGRPAEVVYIVVLPTNKPWEAPAYLRFGGWNANPAPWVHVAALRGWYEKYGAEPMVMGRDVLEVWAPNRPEGAEALELAKEHFLLCEDLIFQGVDGLRTLAVDRSQSQYWFFWWD